MESTWALSSRASHEVLRTKSGKIELAPPYITEGPLARLRERLDRTGGRPRPGESPGCALEQLVDAQRAEARVGEESLHPAREPRRRPAPRARRGSATARITSKAGSVRGTRRGHRRDDAGHRLPAPRLGARPTGRATLGGERARGREQQPARPGRPRGRDLGQRHRERHPRGGDARLEVYDIPAPWKLLLRACVGAYLRSREWVGITAQCSQRTIAVSFQADLLLGLRRNSPIRRSHDPPDTARRSKNPIGLYDGPSLPAPPRTPSSRNSTSRSYRPSRLLLRFVERAQCLVLNRGLDLLPGSNWLHRRILENLEFTDVQMPLHRGGSGAFRSEGRIHLRRPRRELPRPHTTCARLFELHRGRGAGSGLPRRRPDQQPRTRARGAMRAPIEDCGLRWASSQFPGITTTSTRATSIPGGAFLEERGVHVLLNRGERVERNGAGLWLCGVDDLSIGHPDVDAALEGRNPAEPTILLAHHPDYFRESVRRGLDLTLSGTYARWPGHALRLGARPAQRVRIPRGSLRARGLQDVRRPGARRDGAAGANGCSLGGADRYPATRLSLVLARRCRSLPCNAIEPGARSEVPIVTLLRE